MDLPSGGGVDQAWEKVGRWSLHQSHTTHSALDSSQSS